MDKTSKKKLSAAALAVAATAFLALVAVTYAQADDRSHETPLAGENGMMDMMGGKGMDGLHTQMMRNPDPTLIKQMDEMYETCGKSSEGDEDMMKEGMMQ